MVAASKVPDTNTSPLTVKRASVAPEDVTNNKSWLTLTASDPDLTNDNIPEDTEPVTANPAPLVPDVPDDPPLCPDKLTIHDEYVPDPAVSVQLKVKTPVAAL